MDMAAPELVLLPALLLDALPGELAAAAEVTLALAVAAAGRTKRTALRLYSFASLADARRVVWRCATEAVPEPEAEPW